jgi:hypothetical protein
VALGTGFSGHLSIVSLREVLNKLNVAGETGRLCLFTPMARATVWLSAGDVVAAEVGARRGESALDVLSILSDGTFTFFAEASAREGTTLTADALIENWRSKEARVAELIRELPSLIDALTWHPTVLDELRSEYPSQDQLLAALRSGGTLLEALIEVDVELVSALELFSRATLGQAQRAGRGTSTSIGVMPTVQGIAAQGRMTSASGPPEAAGAIVGVRPRRTVLGADKRSTARSASEPKAATDAASAKPAAENLMARTLLGVPLPNLNAAAKVEPAAVAEPKGRPRRISQRTSDPGVESGTLHPLEVGDVLELVPETVRHSNPDHAAYQQANHKQALPHDPMRSLGTEKNVESDPPPPSSIEGGSIMLGGRRLVRVSALSEVGRFSVQLVSDAAKSESEMALKMPRRRDESSFAALQAEAAVLGALSHPNLVRLAQAGLDVETPFLLTSYWPGVTLAELVALTKQLPPNLLTCVVRQVLEVASALHDPTNPRGGFVHCNLCPENVLIGFDGVVRVCGLSNVRSVKSAKEDDDLAVHAQYAAPELLRGQRVDQRADVYSAGALLRLALRANPGPDSPLVGQVRAIVARATDPVAAQRYPNARDFLAALDRLAEVWNPDDVAAWLARELAQLKLSAARAASSSQPPRRNNKRWIAVAVGLLLVVIVALVLTWALKR